VTVLLNYYVGHFVLGSLCVGRFGAAGFEWCSMWNESLLV